MRQGMIRLAVCLLALGLLLSSVPLASASEGAPRRTASATAKPNARDPRYLQYVRDYTGQNALNVGYTSLGGNRMDQYGA